MDAAQEVLCVQGVEESMLGTMGLHDLWVEVLGAVNDMLMCAVEAALEGAAKAVREAESVTETVAEASGGFQFLETLLIWSDHVSCTRVEPTTARVWPKLVSCKSLSECCEARPGRRPERAPSQGW